jgi:integrase
MATVYRRTERRKLPEGSEIVERKGQRFAIWTDSSGRHRARVSKDGKAVIIDRPGYEIQYFDENGRRRKESVRCADADTARRIAAEREKAVLLRKRGIIDATQERFAAEGRRTLTEHVADFRCFLTDKGNSYDHVADTMRYVERIVQMCGAQLAADLTGPGVQKAIGQLRENGASARTCNAYLTAIKSLTRWLWRHQRIAHDALCTLSRYNEESDRRHVRRELTPEEATWLLTVVEKRTEPGHLLAGPDRAMAYRLALGTGFRADELRSLTPGSFALESDPPTVTVGAAYSKRRREDTQPIRHDLADLLRPWLEERTAGERMFARLTKNTSRMLQGDLEAARSAWIKAVPAGPEREARKQSDFLKYRNTAREVVDFHATRHTYISGIVAGGASVKTAQELARHSDPSLTIGRYSHARLHDLQGALEALPSLETTPEPLVQELQATGTDGAARGQEVPTADSVEPPPTTGERRGQFLGQLGGGVWQEVARNSLLHGGASITDSTSEDAADELPQVVPLARNKKGRRVMATAGRRAEGKGFEPSTGCPAPDFESVVRILQLPY